MLTMQMIGNVGGDPEFKETQSGTKLCRLSVAANKKMKGEKITTWVNVTIFDERKIEFVRNFIRKGTKVFLEGEPQARGFLKDGEARASLDLTLGFGSKIEICSSDRADNAASTQDRPASTASSGGWNDPLDDDVPW